MNQVAHLLPNELHTGINDMDAQHEALFSEMQAIKSALMAPLADSAAGLKRLQALERAMADHFHWEETTAAAQGIEFSAHAAEHQRLLELTHVRITEACTVGDSAIPALLVFLDRCFEMHVTHFDQALGRALRIS